MRNKLHVLCYFLKINSSHKLNIRFNQFDLELKYIYINIYELNIFISKPFSNINIILFCRTPITGWSAWQSKFVFKKCIINKTFQAPACLWGELMVKSNSESPCTRSPFKWFIKQYFATKLQRSFRKQLTDAAEIRAMTEAFL